MKVSIAHDGQGDHEMTTRRRRRHTPEQIVRKLRDADAMLNSGQDEAAVLQVLEVSESTYQRWRKQYGGLNAVDKGLNLENGLKMVGGVTGAAGIKPGALKEAAETTVKTATGAAAKVSETARRVGGKADSARYPTTKAEFIDEALSRGVRTERDELILSAGLGKDGPEISNAWAKNLGGRTLQQTPGGSWLASQDLFGPKSPVTLAEAVEIWGEVSKQAVRQASGQIRSVIGRVSPGTIYRRIELPEALNNPNVIGIDELRIVPSILN